MADFDAILKEVQTLRDEHLSLQVLIPKLEEEAKGLRQSIIDAQKELVALEEKQYAVKADIQNSMTHAQNSIASERSTLDADMQAHKEAVAYTNERLSKRIATISEKEAELLAKENELTNLLKRQVDGDNALQQALIDLEKRVGEFLIREATFNREASELESDKDKVGLLILTLTDEQKALASERIEVDNMTREAQALLTKAQKKSSELKEQNDLIQLRIDEYNRKDELLKDAGKRLRKREIALNDKERVYNAH